MKKLKIFHLVMLSLILIIVGCSNSGNGTGTGTSTGNSNQSSGNVNNDASQGSNSNKKVLVNFGGTGSSSGYFPLYVAITNGVNKYSGDKLNTQLQITHVETEGTNDNLNRMIKNEIQMGQSLTPSDYQLVHGIGPYDGKAWEDLRTLLVLYPGIFLPVVRTDSGVDSFNDLDGKPFSAGGIGTSAYSSTSSSFKAIGIEPEYFSGGLDDAFQALKDNEVVGVVKGSSINTIDAGIQEVSLTTDITAIGWTEDQINAIRKEHPHFEFLSLPAGTYPHQDEEIKVQGFYISLVTSNNLSEETVYNILKGIYENRKMIDDAYPPIAGADFGELTIEAAKAPLHAGTVKFFEEMGFEIPEEILPPEIK